jgi:cytochrome c biogenesis protein CcmG/thiol:disulfide interchange protein DsbE
VEEHPLLVELAKEPGLKLVGGNYKDEADNAGRFLGRYGNPFAALGVDPKGRGAIEWGVYGMPETFVVDGQGRIAYKHVGPLSARSIVEKILPAVRAAATATTPAG